jgi:hypothetical protein
MAFSVINVSTLSEAFDEFIESYGEDKDPEALQELFETYGSGATGFDGP